MAATKTIEHLVERIREYHPNPDMDRVCAAYGWLEERYAKAAKKAREEAASKGVALAEIVATLKLDESSIVAALVFHAVRQGRVDMDEVGAALGDDVRKLVDGLSRLTDVAFRDTTHTDPESFSKMLVAMSGDIRILLGRVALRLHRMRRLGELTDEEQISIAQETLDIYAPLANRLGIAWIKGELEDLAFRHLHPDAYLELSRRVAKKKLERERYTSEVIGVLRRALDERSFDNVTVAGRAKHFYSIYKKMQRQGIDFDQVYDLIAFRVIADTIQQCYEILGIVHTLWKPIPGRFKDYIALPKPNGYQSLHTAVIGLYGEKLEIQLRTQEMHRVAEEGIAAHWKYKEGGSALKMKDESGFVWLKQIMEWQRKLRDPNEFLDTVEVDIFSDEIYVFTPQGDLRVLPKGATPVDFAYAVHTQVGNRCIGAKVSGRMVPLRTELHSGDRVEIITRKNATPNRDWLSFVKSSRARQKVRLFVRTEERAASRELGRQVLEKECRKHGKSLEKLVKSGELDPVWRELKATSVEDLYARVGYGKVTAERVLELLLPPAETAEPEEVRVETPHETRERKRSDVRIDGIDDVLVRYAQCCNPVPGDDIVGFITRGRGLTVHLRRCQVAQNQDPARMIDVDWNVKHGERHAVWIRATTSDRAGMLAELTDVISRHGLNMSQAICKSGEDGRASHSFQLSVQDVNQLRGVIRALERLEGVYGVKRLAS